MFSDLSENVMESTDVVGGGCMKGNDGTLCLGEKDRATLWKTHMSKIMNEWDQVMGPMNGTNE